jgi:hypothetical protein
MALALAACQAGVSKAIDIVAVEEHWEIQLGAPDEESITPQVCMVTSPTGSLDDLFFAFTLNHHTAPDWSPGGTQVQVWSGEDLVDSVSGPETGTLNQNNETVSWVQRTELTGGKLVFQVLNGNSTSWGNFGDPGELKIVLDTELANLNAYRPAISIQQSGVSFGGNRVRSLVLQKLRWIDSLGNAYELTAPIDVDADLDP